MICRQLLSCVCAVSICGAFALAETNGPVSAGRIMEGTPGYDILVADIDACAVVRYTPEGKRAWEYNGVKAIDAWPLADGNVLVAYLPSPRTENRSGVRMVSAEKKVLFEYTTPEGEVMSCCPLTNGNVLVAETTLGRITEVDRKGVVVGSFDVKAKGMGHRAVRMIRLTEEGTVLAAECYSHFLREYARDGRFIREFPLKMAFCAQRLANGNTLISGYKPAAVVEMDRDGREVWRLDVTDLPADFNVVHFCEVIRLPNGNTLVNNCVHGKTKNSVVLFEVRPDKTVAWQLRDSEQLIGVTSAKPIR